jgi:plastocyanin
MLFLPFICISSGLVLFQAKWAWTKPHVLLGALLMMLGVMGAARAGEIGHSSFQNLALLISPYGSMTVFLGFLIAGIFVMLQLSAAEVVEFFGKLLPKPKFKPVEEEQDLGFADPASQNSGFHFPKLNLGSKKEPAPAVEVAPEEPTVETKPATLTQEGCQYKPHVIGVQANQPLEVVNGDSTLHNVNIQPKSNPAANFAQPVQGMKTTKKFEKPEVMIPFICNVHPWMKSYVGVVPHPFFAVSGDSGQFEIKGLPAGTYVLEAWHEKMGTAQQKITVKTGEIKPVSFVFTKS